MNTARSIGTLAATLLLLLGCGPQDQDSRGLPQTGDPDPATLIAPGATDFMLDKPYINRIWGSSDKDVWAVGKDGMMLHWDGKIWGRVAVPTGEDLMAIWGASDKDIWAVGNHGVVIHWDGTSWSRSITPVPDTAALNDVWGTSGSNVWAVGDRGVIIQFNGSAWGAYSLPIINNLLTVWAASTTDAWIGGDLGLLLRWNGTSWTGVASGNSQPFVQIRGTSPSQVFAAKQNFEVWNFDGSKWSRLSGVQGQRVWATADNDIWVYYYGQAYHYTTMWMNFSFSDLTALWTSGPTTGWALTTSSIVRLSGTGWSLSW